MENTKNEKQCTIHDVSESIFDKAVEYVRKKHFNPRLSAPYMLLDDVAELIKITTGKKVNRKILMKYSRY